MQDSICCQSWRIAAYAPIRAASVPRLCGLQATVSPADLAEEHYRQRRCPRFRGPARLRVKALEAAARFERRHLIARREFRDGHRGVVFPAGTIQLRKLGGVRVAPEPVPEENPMP